MADLQLFGTSLVVGNNSILIVEYDFLVVPISLDHLLVVAATLDGASAFDFLSHQWEDSFFSSGVSVFKFLNVLFDESNVFSSLIEVPHSYLPVAPGFKGMADLFVFLLVDS